MYSMIYDKCFLNIAFLTSIKPILVEPKLSGVDALWSICFVGGLEFGLASLVAHFCIMAPSMTPVTTLVQCLATPDAMAVVLELAEGVVALLIFTWTAIHLVPQVGAPPAPPEHDPRMQLSWIFLVNLATLEKFFNPRQFLRDRPHLLQKLGWCRLVAGLDHHLPLHLKLQVTNN